MYRRQQRLIRCSNPWASKRRNRPEGSSRQGSRRKESNGEKEGTHRARHELKAQTQQWGFTPPSMAMSHSAAACISWPDLTITQDTQN
jgi:hypothetical protein